MILLVILKIIHINWLQSIEIRFYLFTKGMELTFIALLLYANDIIITRSSTHIINALKSYLNTIFKLTNLRCCLWLQIERSSAKIKLTQHHHTLQLSEDDGALASQPTKAPIEKGNKITFHFPLLPQDNSSL